MPIRPALLCACLVLAACNNPPYPRGTVDELFTQAPRPLLRTVPSGGRSLAYAEIEQAGVPRIVFIHGSPGDWKAWAGYLADPGLRQYGPLLAPDRPGFGASGRGEVVPSLQQQAALLAPLLEGRGAPAIVVGHSLGGAHALRLAVDYPERVRGVLLIAASVAPEREAPRWYNELASWRLLQWIIPDELVHSNRELYGLQAELQDLDRALERLRAPVYAIQGMQDELVDPRTADYLEQRLQGRALKLWRRQTSGHFVLWQEQEAVVDVLRQLIADTAGG